MAIYGYKNGTFSSIVQLENGMRQIFIEAQKATLKRMKDKLDEFITEDVYAKGSDKDWYERTYDLYDIWDFERIYESHGKVYGSIEPTNSSALSHNGAFAQHTSPTRRKAEEDGEEYEVKLGKSKWHDLTTKDYVHIINDGLDLENSMFGKMSSRPFWDEFKKWAEVNYPIIFKEECKARNLPIT